jgi:hypothetical protein
MKNTPLSWMYQALVSIGRSAPAASALSDRPRTFIHNVPASNIPADTIRDTAAGLRKTVSIEKRRTEP